jgi:hypothetical protein
LNETRHKTMKQAKQKFSPILPAVLFMLLAASGYAVLAESKPTLMVIMDEKVMGVLGTTGFEVPTQAEIRLMQHFGRLGFDVVDSKTVKRNITQAKGLRLLEGDDVAAAAVGLQHGAQYSIIGTSISKPGGGKLYGTQLQSIHATLTARVVRNDDARVIATASASAAQAHIDEVRGGAMAIDKAAQDLAQQLSGQILAAGTDAGTAATGELTLNISGLVSYRHLDFVMGFLEKEVPGVSGVELRSYTSGVAELGVAHGGTSAELSRRLASQRFRGFRLEPTHVTPNRIDLRAVLQPS